MATQKNWKVIWKRAKLYIILGIAVFSFAILGMLQGGSEMFSGGGAAAIVNKEVISLGDFMQRVRQMESNMGSYFQELPAAQRENFNAMIRQRALEELISQELMYQTAKQKGLVAPAAAIRDMIVQAPVLQDGGQFSRIKYDQFLQQVGKSASDFEAEISKSLVIEDIQSTFRQSLFPTDIELKNSYIARETKLEMEYVEISKEQVGQKWPVSNSDIDEFKTNSADEIKAYFDANMNEFKTEKQVKASHILIKGDEAKAKDIKAQIDQGADFAKLAKENSEDPGSASKGGDLGFFPEGAMVPEFEQKAFSMSVGEVSEPVKSSFGYHIIKVTGVKGASEPKLEDVEDQIARKLIAEKKIDEWVASVNEALKSDKSSVSNLLKQAGLSWTKTGEFNLNQDSVPNLGDDERLVMAALELKPGEMADKVYQSRGKSYLLKLVKMNKAQPQQAKAELSNTIAQQKAGNVMNLWFEQARKDAKVQRNSKVLSQVR